MSVSSIDYIHPEDKAALENLKSIPLFPTVLKTFMNVFHEQQIHGLNMAQKIRLGPNQLPEIYNYLPPICKGLGIQEPEFYLEMSPQPNAYTFGDTKAFITVTSGLLEYLEEDEIQAVIAHECGHIACRHVLFHTMAQMLIKFGMKIFGPLAPVALPVKLALLAWSRKSELSADRAAALYMGGSDAVVETMIRLSGGPKSITSKINIEEYVKQAEEYSYLIETSDKDMILQGLVHMYHNHPFPTIRTKEIIKWCRTEHFRNIMDALNKEDVNICPGCGNILDTSWKFCRTCGTKIS